MDSKVITFRKKIELIIYVYVLEIINIINRAVCVCFFNRDNAFEFSSWDEEMTNWGYFEVSQLQIGVTYGVYYEVTANLVPVTSTVILTLDLQNGDRPKPASPTISLEPRKYKKILVGSFTNTYSSGTMKFQMTSKNPEKWANNLIINSVVITEE